MFYEAASLLSNRIRQTRTRLKRRIDRWRYCENVLYMSHGSDGNHVYSMHARQRFVYSSTVATGYMYFTSKESLFVY